MAIIETVSASAFIDAFRRMDRLDGWTYDGLRALYDYLDALSEDTGTHIELDVVGLCCDFSEYDSALDAAIEYGFEPDEGEDEDAWEEAALAWLSQHTAVVAFDGGVIVQSF